MPCYYPLIRIETWDGKVTIETKKNFDADITDHQNFKSKNGLGRNSKNWKRADTIPCGKCTGCRLDYSRNWANRIVLESKEYNKDSNWFLTLTYNDENLPIKEVVNTETGEVIKGFSLWKKDLQDFIKRMRYYYPGIRYYAAGEYGEIGERPHYHACIFNLNIGKDKLKKYKNNNAGDAIYQCAEIEEIWGKGFITIAPLSWETAAYTARYIMKKQFGSEAEKYYLSKAKNPEFTIMSRKPGIGLKYYDENKYDIYKNDEIAIPRKSGAIMITPPKIFDKKFELEEKEKMRLIKARRKINLNRNEVAKYEQNHRNPQEQREIEERSKIEKAKTLIRNI